MSSTSFLILHHKPNKGGKAGLNPIDRYFRERVSKRTQTWLGLPRSKQYSEALYQLVVSLSDTQLVTGIAVLVPALYELTEESLTIYHLSIVMDLAWLSSNTHALTLIAIQRKHSSSATVHSPISFLRSIRISLPLRALFILALDGMLLYNSWISAYVYWDDIVGCPAVCTIRPYVREQGGEPLSWTIANFVLVITDYLFVFLSLSPDL